MTSDSDLAPYEMVIQDAVNKAMAGQNVDQLLDTLLSQLPAHLREAIRRKFQEKLIAAQRLAAMTPEEREKQKAPQGKMAQVMFNLTSAASLIAQGTFAKIQSLLNSRSDVRNAIIQEGTLLKHHGVTPEMVRLDNEALGTLAPSVSKDQVKDKGPMTR